MTIKQKNVRFFAGSSNPELAKSITEKLGVNLDPVHIRKFKNDNLYIQLGKSGESVRGRKVFILQSLVEPVSDNLMELLMMIDAAKTAGASSISVIIPYFSYARSDKKDAPRISITAKLVARMIETSGANHVMSMLFHSPQVHGFFDIHTDVLSSRLLFKKQLKQEDLDKTIIISPDIGQAKSAGRLAKSLNLPMAACQKNRLSDTEVVVSGLVGEQLNDIERAIIYDDEIATGGTIIQAANHLIQLGIKDIWACCTHGVFSGNALHRLNEIPEITNIITTNTIPQYKHHLTVIDTSKAFAKAIELNFRKKSIGSLYVFSEKGD